MNFPQRKTLRYKSFNYSQSGWYYVTICIHNRKNLLGTMEHPDMILNEQGKMIEKWWINIKVRFTDVSLDEYIIMPNHIHGIIIISNSHNVGDDQRVVPNSKKNIEIVGEHIGSPLRSQQSLFHVIQWFKTMTTNEYIKNVKEHNWPRFDKHLWQRSYYDHILRNEQDYNRIAEYIKNNPRNWSEDELNNEE